MRLVCLQVKGFTKCWWKWSGDTSVGASAKLCSIQTKDSPTRLRTHLCELRNAMFYIQIQWQQNSVCANCVFSVFDSTRILQWNRQPQNLVDKVLFNCRGKVVNKKEEEKNEKKWINGNGRNKGKRYSWNSISIDYCVKTIAMFNKSIVLGNQAEFITHYVGSSFFSSNLWYCTFLVTDWLI